MMFFKAQVLAFRKRLPVLLGVLRDMWLPLVCAAIYAAWEQFRYPDHANALKDFCTALFFFAWLVSLFYRVDQRQKTQTNFDALAAKMDEAEAARAEQALQVTELLKILASTSPLYADAAAKLSKATINANNLSAQANTAVAEILTSNANATSPFYFMPWPAPHRDTKPSNAVLSTTGATSAPMPSSAPEEKKD